MTSTKPLKIVKVDLESDIIEIAGSFYVVTLDHNNDYVLALCDINGNAIDE
jgi:hypothetical protein